MTDRRQDERGGTRVRRAIFSHRLARPEGHVVDSSGARRCPILTGCGAREQVVCGREETPDGSTEGERITHPIDEDEARQLNLIDGVMPGRLGSYKAGDQCSRYPRRERERLIADGLRILTSRGQRGEVVIGEPWNYEIEETRTIEEG